jgi:hypothetical protein
MARYATKAAAATASSIAAWRGTAPSVLPPPVGLGVDSAVGGGVVGLKVIVGAGDSGSGISPIAFSHLPKPKH